MIKVQILSCVMGRGIEALKGPEQEQVRIRFICSSIRQIFIECLLRTRHCSRSWGHLGDQRQNSGPCGVEKAMSEKALWQQHGE